MSDPKGRSSKRFLTHVTRQRSVIIGIRFLIVLIIIGKQFLLIIQVSTYIIYIIIINICNKNVISLSSAVTESVMDKIRNNISSHRLDCHLGPIAVVPFQRFLFDGDLQL